MNINDAELGKFMELAGETGIKVFLLHGDNWREAVANLAALPGSGNTLGDIRQTTDTGNLYRWNGATWEIYDSNTGNILTAPTTANTAVSSAGGMVRSINLAVGDIVTTADGYIEDEKYGVRFENSTAGCSGQFKTGVISGEKVLRLSTTDITGSCLAYLQGRNQVTGSTGVSEATFEVKPSTKYRVSCLVATSNVATDAVFIQNRFRTATDAVTGSTNTSSKLSGTNGFTLLSYEVTSSATAKYTTVVCMNSVAGNIGYADFRLNTLKFEEIIETVANSLTSTSNSLVSLNAISSSDSIDQAQLTSNNQRVFGGDGSTVDLPTKIAMQIIPTKSLFAGIVLRRLSAAGSFSGAVTISIQGDSGTGPNGTVYATYTYSNAAWLALTVDTDFTVPLPCKLTIGSNYYTVVEATTSSTTDIPSLRSTTASTNYAGIFKGFYSGAWNTVGHDLYFKTLYYKPTTSLVVSQNNATIDINTDEDGLQYGSIIDIVNGKYSFATPYSLNVGTTALLNQILCHSSTGIMTQSTSTDINWRFAQTVVYKVKIPLYQKGKIANLVFGSLYNTTGQTVTYSYSYDDIIYYTALSVTTAGLVSNLPNGLVIPIINNSPDGTIYIKYTNSGGDNRLYFVGMNTDIDTSSINNLYNYPTNKDIIQTYTQNLTSATTIALYRVNKYGRPAIEYSNGEYQYLDIDTTATGSVVAFSSNGSSYTTVTDGASIGLTSTTNPVVWVRSNITANRIYVSSNDYNASSNKDASLKMGIVYQVKNQGLIYDVQDLQKEVNELKTPYIPGMTNITGDIVDEAGSYMIVPTVTGNINLLKVPKAGTRFSVIVRTSGTTSYTLTFNTGFKSTGTLATGTVDAKYFTVNFISDGTQAIETSRTTAM